ncbi:MAG: hypothetical protein J0I49_22865 [Pseudonocardia sp.]|mgnify:CR=1 FL=1|uniref:hypothetical protein n=1 Tax=Pseudonocardia sp. TaxID=60912 RepID=UPI001AD315AC|nr:hypothetical protein [Pseudonocardia sp.]MBN9100927.1 hypothetical protein [Pseudonocardia sp.]
MNTTNNRDVLDRVEAALAACRLDREAAYAMPRCTDWENVARCARLALICARIAAWWGVLARETYRLDDPHAFMFGRAVIVAEQSERDHARFWRDSAADWQARAEKRPTSDAAGALSNWHELGVSA